MARIVSGPQITGQVRNKQTGSSIGPVTVTVNQTVYTDAEFTTGTTTLTTDGSGRFSCYAEPGTYTFTSTEPLVGPIESVEVLSPDMGAHSGTGRFLTSTEASAAYSPLATRLLNRFSDPSAGVLYPAVMATPPTIAYGTARTLTALIVGAHTAQVTPLGHVPAWDSSLGKSVTGPATVGLDFYFEGDVVEIGWFSQTSNADQIWIWVDGQPTTAGPTLPLATTAGTQYIAKLTFASVGRRRITVYGGLINAFGAITAAATAHIGPAPRRPRIAWVGDSFYDYSSGTGNPIFSTPFLASRLLGAEVCQHGSGGSGYTVGTGGSGTNTFGSAQRVSAVAALNPELIVINGSVNDTITGLQAAATAAYAAYAAALPNVPIIVLGPQPANATDTISATRQACVAAVLAAAAAAPNVIAYYDQIGTQAGVPAAWSAGATYNEGDLVTQKGSVYAFRNGGTAGNATSPGAASRWELVTWGRTGTGQVGSTTGDGNRDIFLYSDGIHPTVPAAEVDAIRQARTIRAALATRANITAV